MNSSQMERHGNWAHRRIRKWRMLHFSPTRVFDETERWLLLHRRSVSVLENLAERPRDDLRRDAPARHRRSHDDDTPGSHMSARPDDIPLWVLPGHCTAVIARGARQAGPVERLRLCLKDFRVSWFGPARWGKRCSCERRGPPSRPLRMATMPTVATRAPADQRSAGARPRHATVWRVPAIFD